ncbi:hypothetical protein BDZ91DRAFT_844399 [Kalaharituber pfeilii]|nr:hypothetical protein BDZ91DRAFT_844399 [Kalaharituber pfeilii]
MVSFSCERCCDILAKKKLDAHAWQCRGAQFTCLDCQTTFSGTEYRGHVKCISEAEKYMGKLYRGEKGRGKGKGANGNGNAGAQNGQEEKDDKIGEGKREGEDKGEETKGETKVEVNGDSKKRKRDEFEKDYRDGKDGKEKGEEKGKKGGKGMEKEKEKKKNKRTKKEKEEKKDKKDKEKEDKKNKSTEPAKSEIANGISSLTNRDAQTKDTTATTPSTLLAQLSTKEPKKLETVIRMMAKNMDKKGVEKAVWKTLKRGQVRKGEQEGEMVIAL